MLTVKLKESEKTPRVLKKHPWVFLDELSSHIRSVQPGFPVRLVDKNSKFVAYGIGNPQSQIAFRAWSFIESDTHFFTSTFLKMKLTDCWISRHRMGFRDSFRLCYSEGDALSGIVVDRYLLEGSSQQILVFQLSSSAFETINPNISEFVSEWLNELNQILPNLPSFENTAIIMRRSQTFAEVENLKDKKAVEVIKGAPYLDLSNAKVLYSRFPYFDSKFQVAFMSDFIEGQKTGLFLDQSYNIGLVANWAASIFANHSKGLRILDLCCYRGAWSGHISHHLSQLGKSVEVHLVDQSERALEQAQSNVNPFCARVVAHKGDVMTLLDNFLESDFDIIISDPPAFAKSKKAVHSATEGYFHLNRKALKLSAKESLFIGCSCSSVVSGSDFQKVLERSLLTTGKSSIQSLGLGGHAMDHALSPFFPEGEYLKMRGYWLRS